MPSLDSPESLRDPLFSRNFLCETCRKKNIRSLEEIDEFELLRKIEKEFIERKGHLKVAEAYRWARLPKRAKRLLERGIETANRLEKLEKTTQAADLYEDLGLDDDAIRCRKLAQKKSSPNIKVDAEKVHFGDDRSIEIKDSVLVRSNLNSTAETFKNCPYCGKDFDLPKTPKFCPYCKERLVK